MFTYTQKEKDTQPGAARRSSSAGRTLFKSSWQESSALRLQSATANQAVQPEVRATASGMASGIHGHGFSALPIFARPATHVADKDPQGGTKDAPAADAKKAPAGGTKAPAVTKRAGVESFWVSWTENIKDATAP